MRNARIALAQIAPRLGDPDANADLHVEFVERARGEGADVVVFPELSLTGYVLRDQVAELAQPAGAVGPLGRVIDACRGVDAVVGFVEESAGHRFHNAAAWISDGAIVHVHRKLYLPTYGLFEEGRDFAAGETIRAFDTALGRVGILICEDAWHPTTAWILAHDGADVLIVVSSGPMRGAREGRGVTSVAMWRNLARFTAEFQTAFVAYVNRVGFEDGLGFGGGSVAFDPFGRAIAELPPVESGLTVATLDVEVVRRARTAYPLRRDARIDLVHRELTRLRGERYGIPWLDRARPAPPASRPRGRRRP